jgi:hypothetical protein
LTATSLETPKKSSTYLRLRRAQSSRGYACGFFVISASFRQNSQNARDGTLFHHPARSHFKNPLGYGSLRYEIASSSGENVVAVSQRIHLRAFLPAFSCSRSSQSLAYMVFLRWLLGSRGGRRYGDTKTEVYRRLCASWAERKLRGPGGVLLVCLISTTYLTHTVATHIHRPQSSLLNLFFRREFRATRTKLPCPALEA